jgi:hypothetical protein
LFKLTQEEEVFLDKLHAIAGVDKEDIKKVFESFITYIDLKLYDKIEKIDKALPIKNEYIEFPVPFLATTLKIELTEVECREKGKQSKSGYEPEITITAEASPFLVEDVRRIIKGITTQIEERMRFQIFESLEKKSK